VAGQPEVLRNKALILACWAAVVCAVVMTPVAVATTSHRTVVDYVVLSAMGVASAAVFHRATRMRIELTSDGLDVYKLVTTEHIVWKEIAEVSVDYYGLHLVLADRQIVTAGSMGKPNWATWLRREAAADRWARCIADRLETERETS
jgi:hypothetical protein